jgi:hypothetical protein
VISGSVSSHSYDNLLFAIDFNGNIAWDYTYDVGTDKGGYDLVQLSNGNLASVGFIYDGTNDAQLMITDSVGNPVTYCRYDYSGNDINATEIIDLGSSVGIMLVGNINSGLNRDISVMLVNYSGVVQWSKKYGLGSQDDMAHDALLLNDGTIGIVGNTLNPNSSNGSRCGLVIRIDASGNIISQGGYEPTNTSDANYRFLGVSEGPAGTLRMIGDGVSPTSSEDGLIIAAAPFEGLSDECGYFQTSLTANTISVTKTNPAVTTYGGFGIGLSIEAVASETLIKNSICGSLTGIGDVFDKQQSIQAYPNPAQESLTIYIESANMETKYQLHVFDNVGKQVFQHGFIGNSYQLKTIELANGLYTFTIIDEAQKVTSGKFIVQNQ